MTTSWRRALSLTLLLGAGTAAMTACNWANPHGDQDLPPIKRLVTEPRGATVTLERLNRVYEAPCDLPEDVFLDEELIISKPGYLSYRGLLRDLPQPARGTFKCTLRRP